MSLQKQATHSRETMKIHNLNAVLACCTYEPTCILAVIMAQPATLAENGWLGLQLSQELWLPNLDLAGNPVTRIPGFVQPCIQS